MGPALQKTGPRCIFANMIGTKYHLSGMTRGIMSQHVLTQWASSKSSPNLRASSPSVADWQDFLPSADGGKSNHSLPPRRWEWYNKSMNIRKDPLVNEQYYHIINRSIAQYKVFNDRQDYLRIIELIDLCSFTEFLYKYSDFLELTNQFRIQFISRLKTQSPKFVEIIAYCIMPTHIHLLLKQNKENGISKYMAKVLNSYSRYFNIRHQRIGPLWEGKFKNILVKDDEQMLHLTRYLHLNPVSAGLVKKPEDWEFSSYHEYVDNREGATICDFETIINTTPKQYKKFVHDRINYQKQLSLIKKLLIDDYNG